jgi:hypothetical protein
VVSAAWRIGEGDHQRIGDDNGEENEGGSEDYRRVKWLKSACCTVKKAARKRRNIEYRQYSMAMTASEKKRNGDTRASESN